MSNIHMVRDVFWAAENRYPYLLSGDSQYRLPCRSGMQKDRDIERGRGKENGIEMMSEIDTTHNMEPRIDRKGF